MMDVVSISRHFVRSRTEKRWISRG